MWFAHCKLQGGNTEGVIGSTTTVWFPPLPSYLPALTVSSLETCINERHTCRTYPQLWSHWIASNASSSFLAASALQKDVHSSEGAKKIEWVLEFRGLTGPPTDC